MSVLKIETNRFNSKDIKAWKLRVKIMRQEHKEIMQEMEKQFYEMAAQRDRLKSIVESADRLCKKAEDAILCCDCENTMKIIKACDAYKLLRKEQGK